MTMTDITELGPAKAAEMALELAWKGCKAVYLSFDIDSIDPGFAPGTGSPEPGGLLPREALEMVRLIAREGLCGMEVVEVAPPYDVNDNTAQLAARVILDALGTMIVEGKLGHRGGAAKPRGSSPSKKRAAAKRKS
jgi:agmatinase